jgi:quinol monooxygenase YgiN
MIQVIATIELRPGCRDDFLPVLNENVPRVKAEDGCLAYDPFVDVDSGLPVQGETRPNVVTLVEAWSSLEALHAHLRTPHMAAYREAVKDLVTDVRIQVLKKLAP